jgi:hypothetical protein
MIPRLALVAMLPGCQWVLGLGSFDHPVGDGQVVADARPDSPDGPPGYPCLGTDLVHFCVPPQNLEQAVTIGDNDINTDTDPRCLQVNQINGVPLCAIIGNSLTVASRVRVRGARPLVLGAAGTLTIQASAGVDVSSSATFTGAGASVGCTDVFVPQQPTGSTGAPGGPGGSFRGRGGSGGSPINSDGTAGAQVDASDPIPGDVTVRGGCSGAKGGPGATVGPAVGGQPGGAMVLIASDLDVEGRLLANGAGGAGGPQGIASDFAGGAGGGSGGMIALDGGTITLGPTSVIVASGGGGGGGTDGLLAGSSGGEVDPSNPITPAQGGMGGAAGGGGGGTDNGGSGSSTTLPGQAGQTAMTSGGGGGGGGGAGYIRVIGVTTVQSGAIRVPAT